MSAPDTERQDARELKYRTDTADLLESIASSLEHLANALRDDDEILGALAGQALAANLPALSKNIRDVLAENLTDEAAAGWLADQRYYTASLADASPLPKSFADRQGAAG